MTPPWRTTAPLPVFARYPTRSGLELVYMLRKGAGPLMIFLHGLGSTKMDFIDALLHPQMHGACVLAVDLPGCGDSPYRDGLTLERVADAVFELVEHIGLSDRILIGHSLGGVIGILLAESRARWRAFVNIAGSLAPSDCALLSRPGVAAGRESIVFGATLLHTAARLILSPDADARKFALTLQRNVDPRAYYEYCRLLVEISDSNTLVRRFITLPMARLFIHGDANWSLPYLSELRAARVEVSVIPGASHWPQLVQPEELFAQIAEFVKIGSSTVRACGVNPVAGLPLD